MSTSIAEDRDTWFLILVAMRYCIGRTSYAPSLCADWIMRHWNQIPKETQRMMRRDLESEIERADLQRGREPIMGHSVLGHECDERTWRDLAKWMAQRVEDR